MGGFGVIPPPSMAVLKIPYKGVAHSLPYLRKQVFDSMRYCVKEIPEFQNPEQLFYYLKSKFKYQSDPENVELFQTVQTLLSNNYWGTPGKGDCDDATILTLASLLANGYYNVGIVLAGKLPDRYSHIYAYVDLPSGRKYLDLTNPTYNIIRYYPYTKELPLSISKNQIDMFLQLADNSPKRRKKPKQKLEYLHIPSEGLRVREDQYDHLTLKDFSNCMLSEGYSLHQVSQLASRRTERKAERPRQVRKKEKQELRKEKAESKMKVREERTSGKSEKRKATGQARIIRSQAKQDKANRPVNPDEETPLTKILDTTGNVIGKVVGGQVVPDDEQPDEGNYDETDTNEEIDYSSDEDLQDDNDNYIFFGTPVNKKAANVFGLAAIGLIGYKILS
jgi:hypothetical protein